VSISVAQPAAIDFVVATTGTTGSSDFTVDLTVDTQGLISGLLLKPLVVGASSWSAVDSDVRSAAPVVHLLVARVSDGRCAPAHTIEASAPEPLGSAFKLYVLDALANAISSGRARWDEKLTITDSIKSLPSGELQNDPPGTHVTVLQAATDMISISDNTAADLLARLVGRSNIEAATRSAGMTKPALDAPFLTTRELFTLKLDSWPHLANRYLALTAAQKTTFLTTTVDRIPQKQLIAAVRSSPPWTNPRDINTLEWFASADDICRVYASLLAASQRPGLGNIARVLSVNNGSLGLAANQWRSVWFKGGSEPGVLTLNYLATTRDGRTYVVSFLGENPKAPIQQTRAETALLSAIRGAFDLAAKTA
jgi:Beta-lactamase enzyme family